MNAVVSRLRPQRKPTLFESSILASIAVHLMLFGWLEWKPKLGPSTLAPEIVDVDIRTPFRPRSPDDHRLPGSIPQAPAPASFKPAAIPIPPPLTQKQAVHSTQQAVEDPGAGAGKPKDWILPGPKTQKLEKPTLESTPAAVPPAFTAPNGTGPGGQNGIGGSGNGPGTGDALVNRPPRLVNRDEVAASLRRLYPTAERQAGHEGRVIVSLDIGVDGLVHDAAVAQSGGELFDQAALSVAKQMRFEPALRASVPTQIRVKQSIYFQLTN